MALQDFTNYLTAGLGGNTLCLSVVGSRHGRDRRSWFGNVTLPCAPRKWHALERDSDRIPSNL